jgi:hypothetical protein
VTQGLLFTDCPAPSVIITNQSTIPSLFILVVCVLVLLDEGSQLADLVHPSLVEVEAIPLSVSDLQ